MRRLASDRKGATLIEFAIAAPVLFAFILGALELGHTMYVRAILRGQIEKAARDLSLEGAANPVVVDAIEKRIRDGVKAVAGNATVSFTTTAYHDYRSARDRFEEYDDQNNDHRCDAGEPYVDSNNNGQWDLDSGINGRGGAKDVVLFTATALYPRLALGKVFMANPNVELKASTLLRNQPSADQAAAPMRACN